MRERGPFEAERALSLGFFGTWSVSSASEPGTIRGRPSSLTDVWISLPHHKASLGLYQERRPFGRRTRPPRRNTFGGTKDLVKRD